MTRLDKAEAQGEDAARAEGVSIALETFAAVFLGEAITSHLVLSFLLVAAGIGLVALKARR